MADIVTGFGTQKTAPLNGRGDADPDHSTFIASSATNVVTRSPLSIQAASGDWIEITEQRVGPQDYHCRGIMLRRSTNGCASFGQPKLIYYRSDYAYPANAANKWMNLGTITPNRNGRLFIHFMHFDGDNPTRVTTLKYIYSDDYGATWSASTQADTPADISATCKKIDNTHPASLNAAVFDSLNSAWGFCSFGPGTGYLNPTTGQMIIPCSHRYSLDGTGDSWAHCIVSDDDGANWYIGGGYKESLAANVGTNETAIVRLATGDYYINSRMIGTGTFAATTRGQSIVSSALITGLWPTCTKMTDGTNDVSSNGCEGSLYCDSAGDVWSIFPCNGTVRSTIMIRRSTNGGVSFATSRILDYGFAGYSATALLSTDNFVTFHEATDDDVNAASDTLASQQCIRIKRWGKDWFTNESTYPGIATYYLNDGILGVATYTGGCELGTYDGYGPPGKGGAGASWDSTSMDTGGVTFAGSGAGLLMQSAQSGNYGGMWDAGLGSITYEWIVKFDTTATTWTLFDNRANTGRGFTVQINAGVVSATMSDGTTARTAGSGTAVSGSSVYHNISVVLNRGVTLRVYVDGVLNATISDTMSATEGIIGTAAARVGSLTGGTSPAPASTSLRMMRVTHKALSSFLDVAAVKPSIATLTGYSPTRSATVAALPGLANLKLALFAPFLGGVGAYGSADRFGGNMYPFSPPIDGACISSYQDRSTLGKRFSTYSSNRATYWDTDTEFGRHLRPSCSSSSNGDLWKRSAAATDYDFVQNTGVFTLLMAVRFVSEVTPGDYSALLDQVNGSSSTNGLMFYIEATTLKPHMIIAGNSGVMLNQAFASGLSVDRWYILGVVGNGRAAKPDFYQSIYTAGVPATLTAVQSATNIVGTDGTWNSTNALTIGARADVSKTANVRFGPILLFNSSLTQAQVRQWGAVMNSAPFFPSVGSSRIGTRLGLGL